MVMENETLLSLKLLVPELPGSVCEKANKEFVDVCMEGLSMVNTCVDSRS